MFLNYMSTYRSANTRQSQTQNFATMQKRQPLFAKPQALRQPLRRSQSVASSSVYDPEESPPNIRLSLKQAITLITLRLGKLEVFMNDTKIGGVFKQDGEAKNIDNEFLSSIVSRLDSLEKTQHNLRVEIENIRKGFNEQPVILDIIEKLSLLDEVTTQIQNDMDNLEVAQVPTQVSQSPQALAQVPTQVPETETIEPESSDSDTKFPIYDPNVIEPYQEPLQLSNPDSLQLPEPEPQEKEVVPKTPRKKTGKKVSI
jgi:hypothetical protein